MEMLPNKVLIEHQVRETISTFGIILPESRGLNTNYGIVKKVGKNTFDSFQYNLNPGDKVYFRNDKQTPSGDKDMVVVPTYAVFCIDRGEEYKTIAERYICPFNYVMVEMVDNSTIKTKTGLELELDTSWNKEKTAPTMGVVLKNPEKLVYNGYLLRKDHKFTEFSRDVLISSSLDWDTEMQTSPGDMIHFHYLQQDTVKREGLFVTHDHRKICFIRYDKIMAIETEEDLQPLNGYVFVSMPLKETVTKTEKGVLVVDTTDEQFRREFGHGTVEHMAPPNRDYLNYPADGETDQIQVGDDIVFQNYRRSKVGRDLVIQTSKALDLYRLQRKDIHLIK